MRTEHARLLLAAALLLTAPAGVCAQASPAPATRREKPKPRPPAPVPAPAPPPKAQPKPPPPAPPPKPPPAALPEDEAIIEQLELFMLMEMLKDYEILREPEK
jgi:hypothetical protein